MPLPGSSTSVDKRKHRYHINHPPINIKYNDVDLKADENLLVDGLSVKVKEFFNNILNVKKESNFHISFKGANITIGFESHKFNLVLNRPNLKIIDDKIV